MGHESKSALEKLTHHVKADCAALLDATTFLKDVSPQQVGELLSLMRQKAEGLARTIAEFERNR